MRRAGRPARVSTAQDAEVDGSVDAGSLHAPARPRLPLLVWVVTALHVALLLAYTVLYPAYLGYDEPQHVDMVVALRAGDGWAVPGEWALYEGDGRSLDRVYGGVLEPMVHQLYEVDVLDLYVDDPLI